MRARMFISRDSGALCVGAGEVARALFKAAEKRGLDVEIVHTGSRGMYWLEPTIEVERPEGRIGYGPVKPSDIDSLFDAGMLDGGSIPSPSASSRTSRSSRSTPGSPSRIAASSIPARSR